MSFFKNFLTNKSFDAPLESRMSAVSRDTVETNPPARSLSSSNVEELPSSRRNISKEENRYLNLINQELNTENEKLKGKIEDLKITVATNKQLLEDFISNNSKMDRSIKILRSQIDLMTTKLRENNIDIDEHLDVKFDEKKLIRSNSPTIEGPLSTLTTERIVKGMNDEKTRSEHNACDNSLSGHHSENKYTKYTSLHANSKSHGGGRLEASAKPKKKVTKKVKDREGSVVSSNSSQHITSYRTAPIMKPTISNSNFDNRENELLGQIEHLKRELEGYKLKAPKTMLGHIPSETFDKFPNWAENEPNFDYEEPVSFRDNLVEDKEEDKLQIEWDSDFDYEQFENKLEQNNRLKESKELPENITKIKIKKLSNCYNKEAIMKLFEHLESELSYDQYFNHTKKQSPNIIYLEDESQRIWEIKLNEEIEPRNLDSLSSLKSLDSPMSICSDNLRLSTQGGKNKTAVHDFAKLSIDVWQKKAKGSRKDTDSEIIDYNYQVTLNDDQNSFREGNASGWLHVITYQSIKDDEDEVKREMSFEQSEQEVPEINCFDLY